MTTEPTPLEDAQSSSSAADSNAAGVDGRKQKQSFRRRRRRRGFGSNPGQNGSAPQSPLQMNGAAAGDPTHPARSEKQPRKPKKRFFRKNRNQGQSQNQGQNHGQASSHPRRAHGDSRGNSQQPPRRGNKQRRAKVFVGPMDHSYRANNGNYADAPPSTIDLQRGYRQASFNGNGNGNGNGNFNHGNGTFNGDLDGQIPPTSFDGMTVAANSSALENAPSRIYCFIDDLFFTAKIQEAARKLGIKVNFVKNDKDTVAELLALPEEERPTLIVFDLNSASAKPLTLIPKLKLKLKRATSIIGFLSHLQSELKAKAIEAGCDTVMPRSAFSQSLPNLLRRYGIEAEPETEDSQAQVLEG